MPTELEELVGFLGAPQPHIRQIGMWAQFPSFGGVERVKGRYWVKKKALENVVGYCTQKPVIFKAQGLQPVKDLKAFVGTTVVNIHSNEFDF